VKPVLLFIHYIYQQTCQKTKVPHLLVPLCFDVEAKTKHDFRKKKKEVE
jgi:hypothetical protein